MAKEPLKIVLAKGDGIGPEVANATLDIIKAAGVELDIKEVLVGKAAFAAGYDDGIEPGTIEAVKERGIMLKAPLETPSGEGYKSINVKMRQALGLWANVRPAVAYPQLDSPNRNMNVTLFRENTEGMYVGLTKRMGVQDKVMLDKMFGSAFADLGYKGNGTESFGVQIISDKAAAKIITASLDFAQANDSAEVHGMSKPNILKETDGRFKRNFMDIVAKYEAVDTRFSIADAGFGQTAAYPVERGVLVTQNLYGDFLSDVLAFQAHGSLGLAPSVNIGGNQKKPVAMFEAVHGTANDIEGQEKANPTAFLLSALMMLKFAGYEEEAKNIHDAVMKTWEDGQATGDVWLSKDKEETLAFNKLVNDLAQAANGGYEDSVYKLRNAIVEKFATRHESKSERGTLTTKQFTAAVIGNLGKKPANDFAPCYMSDNYRALLPEV